MSRNSKVNQVILILMDDVRSSHLFELMSKSKLPNMAKLAEEGISSKDCITTFPSITYPCYSNIIIGAYSGYYPKEGSGIPMYHWVARTDPPSEGIKFPFIRSYGSARHIRKLEADLGENVQTIFEQAGEGNHLSALNIVTRGSLFLPPKEYTSGSILNIAKNVFKNPKNFFSNNDPPLVTVVYIPKTDDLMHNKGFDHPDYIQEIIKCDEYIGDLINTLKHIGYYDSTAIAVISDHGNFKAERVYDLEPFFQQKGLIQYNPKKGTGDFDATFGSIGFFNFPGDNWHHHPSIEHLKNFKPSGVGSDKLNLFETLWKIPGVSLMYYRDDNNKPDNGIIHIECRNVKTGKKLTGKIEYKGYGKEQKTKYTFDTDDLFGYQNHKYADVLLDNNFHDINEWTALTFQIDFANIIDQIPRYFKNPRSCDIMISTLGKYIFNYEHGKTVNDHVYSHDIALKKSMTVPFIIGGSPEIPNLTLSCCKTTDMVPTLLDLLGIKPHQSVVGRSIFI